MKKIECYFDGCCEPTNPGGAMGIGALVKQDGKPIFTYSNFHPKNASNTNNIAEYIALESILDYLLTNGLDDEDVVIKGDSQMAVKQMNHEYSINKGGYVPYAQRCLTKLSTFKRPPHIKWIPREMNQEADDLSKGHLAKNNVPVATRGETSDVLTFGKYKGKLLSEIEDIQYLKWALGAVNLKPPQKAAFQKRITEYEHLAK